MKRILIIEDVEMNRDLLVQLLEEDYQVEEAQDGRTGLERVRAARPDLVLLDLSLPEMDGYEVARALKDDPETRATPVIAVTAHAMAGDAQRALAAGCDDYLAKPVDEDELWAKVEKHLGR